MTRLHCRSIVSFGALGWFCSENAPKGSATRCIDCSLENSCPFSAYDLYYVRRDWIANFDMREGETQTEAILRELRTGIYGRCVYRCDNDVVDRQVVAMEMEDLSTITLTMDFFTMNDFRNTYIRMTGGEIDGNERSLCVRYFRTGNEQVFDFTENQLLPFHAGADLHLIDDFLQAVRDPTHKLRSSIDDALDSHRVCYAAEQSRLTKQIVNLTDE